MLAHLGDDLLVGAERGHVLAQPQALAEGFEGDVRWAHERNAEGLGRARVAQRQLDERALLKDVLHLGEGEGEA